MYVIFDVFHTKYIWNTQNSSNYISENYSLRIFMRLQTI